MTESKFAFPRCLQPPKKSLDFHLLKYFWVGFSGVFITACTSGNCRSHREAEKKEMLQKNGGAQSELNLPTDSSSKTRISVYKYDGSLQCGMGKSISLEEMRKQLKDVQVFRSDSKTDNLMHIQMCGSPTGKANAYEIDMSQLDAAKKAGFQEWTFD